MATDRLLCASSCVCTAFYVYRRACGPLNRKTPAVATDRFLCAPPCACTALCMHHLVCAPLCVCTDLYVDYPPPAPTPRASLARKSPPPRAPR